MSKPGIAIALSAATIGGLAFAPSAMAEERTCRGTIGATTVDNVRVPQNANCTLNATNVKGTITVQRNATPRARGVRVVGNVQGENARRVAVIEGSRVGGSVQIVQGGSGAVTGSRIGGDILFDEDGAALRAVNNRVGGSLQAFQNSGGVEIRANVIDGNLQCKENAPRPVGGGNTVGGNKEDQCANL